MRLCREICLETGMQEEVKGNDVTALTLSEEAV